MSSFVHLLLLLTCFFSLHLCFAVDRVTFSTPIKDLDSESLLSSDHNTFRLGFFSPVNSTNRYVGIWYNNIPEQTVVWVANKNTPIYDSSGVISISDDGNLAVTADNNKQILWSSNISLPVAATTWALLLDSGNLVLQGNMSGHDEILWESFKHPYDSFLPKMIIGTEAKTGETRELTSWKSDTDPSVGDYSLSLVSLPFPEVFIKKNGLLQWRTGPWNGQVFIGVLDDELPTFIDGFFTYNDRQGTVLMTYTQNQSMCHFALGHEGVLYSKDWNYVKQEWRIKAKFPEPPCNVYNKCGGFASCNSRGQDPPCKCIKGFVPKSYAEWNRRNWTSGCIRRVPLSCRRQNRGEDRFVKLRKMKVPMSAQRSEASEQSCLKQCLDNCSCTAYAFDLGIGCMIWSGRLLDMQDSTRSGIDLYIRVSDSELKTLRKRSILVVTTLVGAAFVVLVLILLTWRKLAMRKEKDRNARLVFEKIEALTGSSSMSGDKSVNKNKLKELPPLFEFQVLATATDNFAITNKLGQGGFGPVYKGKLQKGQEIAVKRLSRGSGQGLEELVNEIVMISKLQHRNLVRLLGCCIEGEEMMLVYELMPNKSLDAYLFDPEKQKLLDWKTRFNIMEGICRGLMYLHRDSRLRIIHRDLKASNILLDETLNPKISDFGIARIFQGNENEAETRRVVGTYGYMSPEYAMGGVFSEKSDVFSLGVLLLEIISGRKNSSFYNAENLLDYARRLWNEGDVTALADPQIYEESFQSEIRRCVHIGLLCVQYEANDRPSVSTVILMLSGENASLPEPKRFIAKNSVLEAELSEQGEKLASINHVSHTSVSGR